jgi:large subunit ribosomal protein L28
LRGCPLADGREPTATAGPSAWAVHTKRFQEITVAAVCDICGKGPGFGNKVSHSHRRTRRRFDPNIQRVRATVNGSPKRLNVCTSCLKAGKVTR